MYTKVIDPNKVAPFHHESTNRALVELARKGELNKLGVIPTFKMPQEYGDLGEFVLIDGHTRRAAALLTNTDIEITVIEGLEDLEKLGWDRHKNYESFRESMVEKARNYERRGVVNLIG